MLFLSCVSLNLSYVSLEGGSGDLLLLTHSYTDDSRRVINKFTFITSHNFALKLNEWWRKDLLAKRQTVQHIITLAQTPQRMSPLTSVTERADSHFVGQYKFQLLPRDFHDSTRERERKPPCRSRM